MKRPAMIDICLKFGATLMAVGAISNCTTPSASVSAEESRKSIRTTTQASKRILEAEELRIVDKNGKARIRLSINKHGYPSVELLDSDGDRGMVLEGPNEWGMCWVQMIGPDNKLRMSLALEHYACPVLRLRGSNGREVIVMGLGQDDSGAVVLMDQAGKIRLHLGIDSDEPVMKALDEDKNTLWEWQSEDK